MGGVFNTVNGVPASNIAGWDGSTWTALGQGVDYPVCSIVGHNDEGSDRALYAGGNSAQTI